MPSRASASACSRVSAMWKMRMAFRVWPLAQRPMGTSWPLSSNATARHRVQHSRVDLKETPKPITLWPLRAAYS